MSPIGVVLAQQAEVAQAGVAAAADDQVVVHRDAERLGGVDDVARDGDVGLRRGRVAGRMVVHQDQGGGVQFEGALDDLARVVRRVVDRAALLPLVFDQHVLAVEEQQVKFPELCRCLTYTLGETPT